MVAPRHRVLSFRLVSLVFMGIYLGGPGLPQGGNDLEIPLEFCLFVFLCVEAGDRGGEGESATQRTNSILLSIDSKHGGGGEAVYLSGT